MKSIYDVIRSPIITEKGAIMQAENNKYMFQVAVSANKKEIKEAIEKIYNVKVTGVRTMNVRGKMKRVRAKFGLTSAWKKAIITLKAGDTIDFTE